MCHFIKWRLNKGQTSIRLSYWISALCNALQREVGLEGAGGVGLQAGPLGPRGGMAPRGRGAAGESFSKTCPRFRAAFQRCRLRDEGRDEAGGRNAVKILHPWRSVTASSGCAAQGKPCSPRYEVPSGVPAGSTPSAEAGHRQRAPFPLLFFSSLLRLLLLFSASQSRSAIHRRITRMRG